MCGICGKVSITNSETITDGLIRKMSDVLKHRGPDDGGSYLSRTKNFNPEIVVGLGHRRLSIIDLSKDAHQPMSNEDQSIWIVYNGEIYNFHELRCDLENKGHQFKSHSDTEVIIHLYEEKGIEFVKKLRGMFALAIWDEKKSRLFLARDRFGKKPLFYVIKGDTITFASELKSLLQDKDIGKSIDLKGLNYYLTYGYIPAPYTIFKEIKKLLPAHILVWDRGVIDIRRYWSIDFTHKLYLSEEDFCEKVLDLFKEATRIRLISDVPLGVFLSGGIDSSAVTAMMSQISAKKIKTFSIGFQEQSFNELKYADIVAKHFDTEHHEFIVKPDALSILPELITHFGEPFADSSAIPTYYLSKFTKSEVTVALSGDGGDETFAGYDRYIANKIRCYFHIFSIFDPLLKLFPESTSKKGIIKRLKRFSNILNLPKERAYASIMDIFSDIYRNNLYTDELKYDLNSLEPHDYILDTYNLSNIADFLDATLYVDTCTYLPNDLLVKADITSMANSLEIRSPFLDHKLVEFVSQIPSSLKLKGLTGKYILKKSLSKLLPKQILRRQKAGFGLPVGTWLKKDLKEYAYDMLLNDTAVKRGYFKRASVKNLLDEHTQGKIDHSQRIWGLIVLEEWHRIFVDT